MLKLALKNIRANSFGTTLSIILVALSAGLVIFFAHVNQQFQQTMEGNTAGIHLILAAKGSPLQAVLCNLYHIDNPTGNVKVGEVKAFFNPKHPYIDRAIPLSIGDNYRAHRIVGTTKGIADIYGCKLAQGDWWTHANEVVVGNRAALNLNLQIGSTFQSSHGLVEDGMDHTHYTDLKVVGILERGGTVIDNLILTSFQTIWEVHGAHVHDEDPCADHDEYGHLTTEHEIKTLLSHPEKEITSVLLTFKNHNHQTLNLGRSINQNSTFQAAHPARELTRLYSMIGAGARLLSYLAWLIGLVSMVSIFLSLLQSLKSRKYDLALLRVMGAQPKDVFFLIILEGLIQVLIGTLVGILIAHFGLYLVDLLVQDAYKYNISPWSFDQIEFLVIVVALGLGIVASIWPAILAYRTDVSKTLQSG